MSAEIIIKEIQKDAEQEIKNIQKETELEIKKIHNESKKQIEEQNLKLQKEGEKKSDNIEKIYLSKANQEAKKKILKTKEEIMNQCFQEAYEKLKKTDENTYEKMLTRLLKDAKNKLGENCKIKTSRDIDKKLAKDQNIDVIGSVKADGGIIVFSSDEKVLIDLTFEAILKRERDKLRIKIGSLLFS